MCEERELGSTSSGGGVLSWGAASRQDGAVSHCRVWRSAGYGGAPATPGGSEIGSLVLGSFQQNRTTRATNSTVISAAYFLVAVRI